MGHWQAPEAVAERPLLRGVIHQVAFSVSLVVGTLLDGVSTAAVTPTAPVSTHTALRIQLAFVFIQPASLNGDARPCMYKKLPGP